MRLLFFICFFSFSINLAHSNGNNGRPKNTMQAPQQARPNLPGDLIIDIGASLFKSAPDTMAVAPFRSRAANIYYLYRIRLGNSNFSFHPGFGMGFENYMFKDDDVTLITNGDETEISDLQNLLHEPESVRKSKLNVNYFDVPLELRFSSNKNDPNKGMIIIVGGRIGILFDSKTKIKYEIDDKSKIFKSKEDFSLNRIRYGIHGRLGVGNFSVFYYQNLSNFFKQDKGPAGTNDTQTYMAGLSFALF